MKGSIRSVKAFVRSQKNAIIIFFITLVAFTVVIETNLLRYEGSLEKDPHATHLLLVYGDEPFNLAITSTIVYNHSIYAEDNFLGPDLDPNINKSKWPEMFRDPTTWRAEMYNGHYIPSEAFGLPYIMIPGYAMAGMGGAMMTMAIASSFVSVIIYKFTSFLSSARFGFITAIIFSFATLIFTYSNELYSDVLIMLFLITILYFIFQKNKSKFYMSYTGALLGFGFMLKISFLLTDIVILPAVFAMVLTRKISKRNFSLFMAFFCLLTLCWAVNNYLVWGSWLGGGSESVSEMSSTIRGQSKTYVATNYSDFLVEYFFGKYHGLFVFSPVIMLSVLGTGSFLQKHKALFIIAVVISLSIIFGHMLTTPILAFTGDDPPFRYLMPIVPIMSLPFSLGLQRFSRKLAYRVLLYFLGAVGLAFSIYFGINRLYSLDHFPTKNEGIHLIYWKIDSLFTNLGPSYLGGEYFPYGPLTQTNEIFVIVILSLLVVGVFVSFMKRFDYTRLLK